ncbi:MAG: hypothetical protein PHE41_06705 [Eubacteriales bacterium]|nr:hypothetical protein [Eubacteriales bacterium]
MKKFLIQVAVFVFIVLGFVFLIFSLADGYTDPFYIRFTTPVQNSLIIGTSRAAQGIQPALLKKELNEDIFNYSFTVGHSPYGPTYFNSIRKKLNKQTTDGVFIVTVDPWSISSRNENPNDSLNFAEIQLCVGNTKNVTAKPNVEYLFKNMKGKYADIIKSKIFPNRSGMFLHDDGWLDVTIDIDSVRREENIKRKADDYRETMLPFFTFSSFRFNYLRRTIQFLNNHGTVYLVRLPVHPEIFEIEQQLMPDFNTKIEDIIPLVEAYYDMTGENAAYAYIDGNHLYKVSRERVTENIANFIKDYQ